MIQGLNLLGCYHSLPNTSEHTFFYDNVFSLVPEYSLPTKSLRFDACSSFTHNSYLSHVVMRFCSSLSPLLLDGDDGKCLRVSFPDSSLLVGIKESVL